MKTDDILQNNLARIALIVVAILLIPFTAMRLTNEMNWSITDFTVAGALLFGTGLFLDQVAKKVKNKSQRIIVIITIIITFLLVWAELAVGLFGTPFAGS